MCLSQGVNEKLCAFPFSVLVTDCNPPPHTHTPSLPASSPPPPSSPPSTSPQPFWPEGGVITGAVDSAALGFGSLLYWADSLIKHANRIYRTRLNNHSPCKCYVVSDGISLCLSLFSKIELYNTSSCEHTVPPQGELNSTYTWLILVKQHMYSGAGHACTGNGTSKSIMNCFSSHLTCGCLFHRMIDKKVHCLICI